MSGTAQSVETLSEMPPAVESDAKREICVRCTVLSYSSPLLGPHPPARIQFTEINGGWNSRFRVAISLLTCIFRLSFQSLNDKNCCLTEQNCRTNEHAHVKISAVPLSHKFRSANEATARRRHSDAATFSMRPRGTPWYREMIEIDKEWGRLPAVASCPTTVG